MGRLRLRLSISIRERQPPTSIVVQADGSETAGSQRAHLREEQRRGSGAPDPRANQDRRSVAAQAGVVWLQVNEQSEQFSSSITN